MVELSIEVMEGLRDPLIGLRCWISRCTCTTFELAVAQRLHEFMRGIYEFSHIKCLGEAPNLFRPILQNYPTSLLYSCRRAKWAKVICIVLLLIPYTKPLLTGLKTPN